MDLKNFIAYLKRRFPPKADILDVHISMIADKRTGLVETVTMLEDDDFDEPDGGQSKPDMTKTTRNGLKLVS
jgi:hypothetical protein